MNLVFVVMLYSFSCYILCTYVLNREQIALLVIVIEKRSSKVIVDDM